MDFESAKKRIEFLTNEIRHHNKLYYDQDSPEISDFEYDMLMLELRDLEKKFPEFVKKESYTQHVGGNVKSRI